MENRPGRPNEQRSRKSVEIRADELADPVAYPPRRYPGSAKASRRNGLPWWAGCGLFFIGFVVGVLGLLGGIFLFFGTTSNQPLTAPLSPAGTPDISADLSQTYLNVEVSRNLKSSPVKLLDIVDLKALVLDVQSNQQVLVTARIGTPVGELDVGITEIISAQDGLVQVRATGQPRLGTNFLPFNISSFVNALNTTVVQPQINQYVTGVKANGRTLKLVGLTTAPGIISAKFNAQ